VVGFVLFVPLEVDVWNQNVLKVVLEQISRNVAFWTRDDVAIRTIGGPVFQQLIVEWTALQ